MECNICYESIRDNAVKCCQCIGIFHHDCVKQWYETKNQAICPYCKYSHDYCDDCDSTFFEPVSEYHPVLCRVEITIRYYIRDEGYRREVSEEEYYHRQRIRENERKRRELESIRIYKEDIKREMKKRTKWNQQRIPRKRQNKMMNKAKRNNAKRNNGRRQCRNKIF